MEQQIYNNDYLCTKCDDPLVPKSVQLYSKKWFGRVLCRQCQGIVRGEKILKGKIDHTNCETINLDNGQVGCITHQVMLRQVRVND